MSRRNSFFGYTVLALTVTVLCSCSPVYQTSYSYHPIAGRQGQMCSNTCLVTKQSCVQSLREGYERCEAQAEVSYRLCEAGKIYGYNKKGEVECIANCGCWRQSCSQPAYGQCEEAYKECYLNCGGEVTSTTACTSFCEEAQPPIVQRLKRDTDGSTIDVLETGYEKSPPKKKATTKAAAKPAPKVNTQPAGASRGDSTQAELERLNEQMKLKSQAPEASAP